jgi:hypothetical protein
MAALRATIIGQSSIRNGRVTMPCVADNVLFGVTLHAAARHLQWPFFRITYGSLGRLRMPQERSDCCEYRLTLAMSLIL